MPRRAAFAVALVAVLFLRATPAAPFVYPGQVFVDVRVVDRNGTPVAGAVVTIGVNYGNPRCGITGLDGRATCTAPEPGSYALRVAQPDNPFIVQPDPPFSVNLQEGDKRVAVELRVENGDRLSLSVMLGHEPGFGSARFTELTHNVTREVMINKPLVDVVLPPGEWRIDTLPVPGCLLSNLVIDRGAVPLREAIVVVTSGGGTHNVTWEYAEPAVVRGTSRWDEGPYGPGVAARLLQPGPQLAEALARGVPFVPEAHAELDGTRYWLRVADGSWLVAPSIEPPATSEPPDAALTLAAGETQWLDFVSHRDSGPVRGGRGLGLLVGVSGEGRVRPQGAVIELREAGQDASSPPLARKRMRWSNEVFDGLKPGSYVVSAGHEAYGDAKVEVTLTDDKQGKSRSVSIALPLLNVVVIDGSARDVKPVANATVEFTADGTEWEPLVSDEELVARRRVRAVQTDTLGRAWVSGLAKGRWRVRATPPPVVTGPPVLLQLGASERSLAREYALELGGCGETKLLVRPVQASAVTARLRCTDRGPLPPRAALQLLPEGAEPSVSDETPAAEDAARFGPRLWPLVGREERRLEAGPFTPGAYVTGVRPDGFARWTWFGAGESRRRAVPLPLSPGAAAELGMLELDCGPTVRFDVAVRSKAALPELDDVTVTARFEPATQPGHAPPDAVAPRVDTSDALLRLRALPEARGVLHARVNSPFFIPGAVEIGGTSGVTLTLTRGGEAVVPMQLDDVGGAIAVDGAGAALRLTPAGGAARVVVADAQGRLRAEHLAVGAWTVEVCGDGACRTVQRVIGNVDVQRAAWTRVAANP